MSNKNTKMIFELLSHKYPYSEYHNILELVLQLKDEQTTVLIEIYLTKHKKY